MSASLRHLRHPGPALQPRAEVVFGHAREVALTLPPGLTLLDAITRECSARGIDSASLSFGPGVFDPLVYYLPAIVEGPYLRFGYGEAQRPEGAGRLEMGYATFGRRDGLPFVHCHAVWLEEDGQWHGGHVLPSEAVLARPLEARALSLPGVALLSELDPETDYQLFHPVRIAPEAPGETGKRAAYVRVKPNEDLTAAVAAACRQLGYRHATVRGLGSLIGARFADGGIREDQGSEIVITNGTVHPGPDGLPVAEIDICFSGFSGLAYRGRLLPDQNPVCITFELLVEEGP